MLSSVSPIPLRHHLNRRASDIAALGAEKSPDDLLTTPAVAEWLGVSTQGWKSAGQKVTGRPSFGFPRGVFNIAEPMSLRG